MKNSIFSRILQLKQKIRNTECRFRRRPGSVQLIAISKGQSLEAIRSVSAAGQLAFGESYAQEAAEKILNLKNLKLEWHFIGRIQTNKTKFIANHFSWVHSLADLKSAVNLNEYRKKTNLMPINVCIQVNLQNEVSKAGINLEHLVSLAKSIDNLPHLNLRGLMTIPKREKDFSSQCKNFKALRLILEGLQIVGLKLDTLSMGMTGDFEAAIAEGATLVRLGTAIFGKKL